MVWCEKCKKYHDGTGCPSASIFPSAITDWVDGQCFKQTGQATIDIDGLKAEISALRAERNKLRNWVIKHHRPEDIDETCAECSPYSPMVIPDYRCAYHAALKEE